MYFRWRVIVREKVKDGLWNVLDTAPVIQV
jgi:hypothetical protein